MESSPYPYYLIWMLFFITSCSSNSFETKEKLLAYVIDEKNGYSQKKVVNGVKFSMIYRPTDLVVANEWSETFGQDKLDGLRKKYNANAYFNLSVSKGGRELLTNVVKNKEKYSSLLRTMSFGMNEKLIITNEVKDTIPLLDFIAPRMYDLSGSNTIMLIVDKSQPSFAKAKQLKIAIDDIGFRTGEVSFIFDMYKIQNQPKLNF